MKTKFFTNIFDTWLTRAPDGRPFVDPPWEVYGEAGQLPFYLAPYKAPVKVIFFVLVSVAFIAFIVGAKIGFPLCAGILAILYYALKESWLLSSALLVESGLDAQKIGEKQPFQLHLKVSNHGNSESVCANLYFEFAASRKTKHFLSVPQVPSGTSRNLTIDLLADAGMGQFDLREIFLITTDRFGLFRRCVRHEISLTVEVSPEYVPMPPLRLTIAGRASHSGTIEAKSSGDSTKFLGLREFREGDSIRRIDWKRTAKHNSLIVRDFEKLNSTDATVFIDSRFVGLFEFNGLNSFEHLKDAIVTLCHTLIDQGVRIQLLFQDGRYLPFCSGSKSLEELVNLIRDLKPDGAGSFVEFLDRNKQAVPPDSLVIPAFSAVDIDIKALHELFFGWNSIRCEVVPVVVDAPRFEHHVVRGMESFSNQKMELSFFRQLYMGTADTKAYENISRKIYENTIRIGPGESIGDVYARMHPWQR